MTTIAFRAGLMACDSCWTGFDDEQQTSETKIVKLPTGALLGQAGDNDSRSVAALFAAVKTEKQLPTRAALADLKTDFAGLFVLPNGKVFLVAIDKSKKHDAWDGQLWPANRFGFAACGSGAYLALGAMAAGKSARDAVRIACDFDKNSRGPVHVVSLARKAKP